MLKEMQKKLKQSEIIQPLPNPQMEKLIETRVE